MSLFKIPDQAYDAVESAVDRRTGLEHATPHIAHAAIRGLVARKPDMMVRVFDIGVFNLDLIAMVVLLFLLDDTDLQVIVAIIMGLRLLSIIVDAVWWREVRRRAGILSKVDVNDYR